MPNERNELTDEEKSRAIAWLTEKKAANSKCPMCENESWAIGNVLVIQPTYIPGGFVGGSGYPSVIVFCRRCAFIRLHNAIAMGLVEVPKKKEGPTEPKEEVKHGA